MSVLTLVSSILEVVKHLELTSLKVLLEETVLHSITKVALILDVAVSVVVDPKTLMHTIFEEARAPQNSILVHSDSLSIQRSVEPRF